MSWFGLDPNGLHLDLFENCKLIVLGFSKRCSTSNVEDLVAYTGPIVILDDPFKEPSPVPNTNPILDPIQPSFPPAHKELLMLFWMSRFFLLGMEEFRIS
jgi:hypothetical protein